MSLTLCWRERIGELFCQKCIKKKQDKTGSKIDFLMKNA